MIPVITIIGGSFGAMVGGNTVLGEPVQHSRHRLVLNRSRAALGQRDYPVVQADHVHFSDAVIRLLVYCCKWIDPRVKLD